MGWIEIRYNSRVRRFVWALHVRPVDDLKSVMFLYCGAFFLISCDSKKTLSRKKLLLQQTNIQKQVNVACKKEDVIHLRRICCFNHRRRRGNKLRRMLFHCWGLNSKRLEHWNKRCCRAVTTEKQQIQWVLNLQLLGGAYALSHHFHFEMLFWAKHLHHQHQLILMI